jgi:arylformamidase
LSPEAVQYLAELPIKAFATDAWSIANPTRLIELTAEGAQGYAEVAPEHHVLLTRGIPIVEALENVEELVDEQQFVFVAFPLKIADGNGSPTRTIPLR